MVQRRDHRGLAEEEQLRVLVDAARELALDGDLAPEVVAEEGVGVERVGDRRALEPMQSAPPMTTWAPWRAESGQ